MGADAGAYGTMIGQSLSFICPAFGTAESVWGTDTYTGDSSPCTAAVLEGKLTLSAGGSVTIQMGAGKSSYKGSTAHGITSNSYASFSTSFTIVAAGPAAAVVGYGGSGWDTGTNAYSSFLGARFSFGCPTGGTANTVWGTGSYTYDSSVCTAAVLEGKITLASGGTVTVEIIPGQSSYKGSTSNGITSNAYGSYNGGFTIVGATRSVPSPSPGGSGWNMNPSNFRSAGASRLEYFCPTFGTPNTVWGSGTYTDDSSVCTAAVLEGKITLSGGGTVTIELRPGQASYKATSGNGIKSSSYGSWSGSFVITGANAKPAEIGEGGTGWNASPGDYTNYLDSRFAYACPAKGTPGSVWGTGTYTSDSSVCTAAVHSGLDQRRCRRHGHGLTWSPAKAPTRDRAHTASRAISYGSWSSSYVPLGAKVAAVQGRQARPAPAAGPRPRSRSRRPHLRPR